MEKYLRACSRVSATLDGKTVYYTQDDRESVIKMMEIPH
jgi:hypothetical protein